jgi:peptidyl-prolyl cis-trans isomerase SurA
MHFRALTYSIALFFAACAAVPVRALEQEITIRVNGEVINSHDIVQRTLYESLPTLQKRVSEFYEHLNALINSDKVREKFREKMSALQPHTPEETRRATERVQKEMIEETTLQILSERNAIRRSVIDALIDDKLKLQAARRLAIEITDDQVAKSIIVDRLAEGEEPDVNAYYAPRMGYGISRKTLQEIIRAQLAWRAVMLRTYGPAPTWQKSGVYEGFSRAYLERLRQHAIITRDERP